MRTATSVAPWSVTSTSSWPLRSVHSRAGAPCLSTPNQRQETDGLLVSVGEDIVVLQAAKARTRGSAKVARGTSFMARRG